MDKKIYIDDERRNNGILNDVWLKGITQSSKKWKTVVKDPVFENGMIVQMCRQELEVFTEVLDGIPCVKMKSDPPKADRLFTARSILQRRALQSPRNFVAPSLSKISSARRASDVASSSLCP